MGIEGKGAITKEMAVAALSELERELALRKRVYDRLIREGKLSYKQSRKQIESLRFALLIVKDLLESRGIIHAAQRLIEVGEKSERDCEECRKGSCSEAGGVKSPCEVEVIFMIIVAHDGLDEFVSELRERGIEEVRRTNYISQDLKLPIKTIKVELILTAVDRALGETHQWRYVLWQGMEDLETRWIPKDAQKKMEEIEQKVMERLSGFKIRRGRYVLSAEEAWPGQL